MDILLGRVTQQAMNYAIRSGITITTTYAIRQCGRLLKEAPRGEAREELLHLQLRLESKIRIISPAIDMIELISARGNTSLESAVSLIKEIRYEIQKLGTSLSDAANDEALLRRKSSRAKSREETARELRAIIASVKALLHRIEDAVPLINLAITTSGVNLSTKLSGTISPSRLLQASTFLTAADTKYATQPTGKYQVGPTWTLSMYMLFAGHVRPMDEEGVRATTWKEVVHKARLKLVRVPLERLHDLPGETSATTNGMTGATMPAEATSAEFAYQLVIIEDLDDDRVHTFEDGESPPGSIDDVSNAGIRDVVPIHEVSKIFYADTGKILNIGNDSDTNSPVLLLKRDIHAEPPRRMLHRSQVEGRSYFDDEPILNGGSIPHDSTETQSEIDAQLQRESVPNTPIRAQHPPHTQTSSAWRLPADLDPEWMAFEVYTEALDSESEGEEHLETERPRSGSRQPSLDPFLTGALSTLKISSPTAVSMSNSPTAANRQQIVPSTLSTLHLSPARRPGHPQIKTSLSLLEMLLKLTALQQFRQESHLAIEDELLNFFLEDSSTAGAGPDKDYRQRMRHDAVKRVGFDPYDESPIKRRGEEYISHARGAASPRPEFDPEAFPHQHFPYDDSYGFDSPLDPPRIPTQDDDFAPPLSERAQPSITKGADAEDDGTRDLLSSPSPQPPQRPLHQLQQTPSRSSNPGSAVNEQRPRNTPQAKPTAGSTAAAAAATAAAATGARSTSPANLLVTPPSTARSRGQASFLLQRAHSEPKSKSPLANELRRAVGREW